jgi:hypothetical protein
MAFRDCLFMEWDHKDSVLRISFRLIGTSASLKIARTYSIDSRVGFAPGRANSGRGGARRLDMPLYIYMAPHKRIPPR